jgi:valyl-tRNA synthetase
VNSGWRLAARVRPTPRALTFAICCANVTDDAAERTRAAKELESVEKQIAGKEGKLRNQQFVTNAKPEVVKAESDRLSELVAQRETLRNHLVELG